MIIRFVNSGLFTISGLFVVSLLFAPAQLPQLTYMNLPAYAANDTKAKFEELATTWAEHCSKHAMSSSTHTYLYPPQVKAIVALGPSVIPLIMTRYGNDACPWGFVLQDITGLKMIEDPNHFSPAQMQRDFSSWYEILMRGGAFACLKNGQIEGLNRAPKPFGGCRAFAGHIATGIFYTERYSLACKQPIISTPAGNQHISDIRAGDKTLDIALAWDMQPGKYSLACVPWTDITGAKVNYGLPEHYDPTGLPRDYNENPLARDAERDVERNAYKKPFTLSGTRLTKVDKEGKELWTLEVPHGHKIVAFSIHNNLLFIATNSDQGGRDGELMTHYLTTNVYATFCPQ